MANEILDFEETLSVDFVDELLKTCLVKNDKGLNQLVTDTVKENYLPEEEQRKFYHEFKELFKLEHKMPSFGLMQIAFKGKRGILEYIERLKDVEVVQEDTILHGLETFVKTSKFIELYDSVGDMYNKGQKREAISKLIRTAEELGNFNLKQKQYTRIFGDFGKRNINRILKQLDQNERIPTGIELLDKAMHGGPEIGDLFCWLGDSKAGKSFALSHCGLTAARRGYPVLHIQAEDTEEKCTNRYDSAWLGIPYYDIKDGNIPKEKLKAFKKIVDNIGKGEIYVYAPEQFGTITVGDIRNRVINLRKAGVDIKVLVVDYWDLINPDNETYKPSDERFRQQKVGRMLKDMALELGLLIYTATQTSSIESAAINDENFVITREFLAEDKGKVRPVNHLVSINSTKEERKNKIARLWYEATRDHAGDNLIKIKRNLERSRFYDALSTRQMYEEMMSKLDDE